MQQWEETAEFTKATGEASGLATAPEVPYKKLRPGPGQPASDVAAHQRRRIRAALIQIVAERGYRAVKVRDIVQRAGVSSRAFYEHFGSKEDCLLRTHELVTRRATQQIIGSQSDKEDGRERLRAAFEIFAQELKVDPVAARFVLIETRAAGPAGLEQVRRAESAFEGLLRESLALAPDRIAVPPLMMEGIVAGVMHVARARLLAGREGELPGLVDELVDWALCCSGEHSIHLTELDRQSVWRNTTLEPLAVSPVVGEQGAWPPTGDRALILSTTIELYAASGYDNLTATHICSQAKVARRAFASHFESVEDCFLTAMQQKADEVLTQAARAQIAGRTWPGGVYRAIAALCDQIVDDPFLARACFIDDFAPGSRGLSFRQRLIAIVVERLNDPIPAKLRTHAVTAEASNGAIWALFHRHVIGNWAKRQHIAATLAFIALAPLVSGSAAVAAIRREQTGPC